MLAAPLAAAVLSLSVGSALAGRQGCSQSVNSAQAVTCSRKTPADSTAWSAASSSLDLNKAFYSQPYNYDIPPSECGSLAGLHDHIPGGWTKLPRGIDQSSLGTHTGIEDPWYSHITRQYDPAHQRTSASVKIMGYIDVYANLKVCAIEVTDHDNLGVTCTC